MTAMDNVRIAAAQRPDLTDRRAQTAAAAHYLELVGVADAAN